MALNTIICWSPRRTTAHTRATAYTCIKITTRKHIDLKQKPNILKNIPSKIPTGTLKGGNPPLFFHPPRSKNPPRNKHTRIGNVFLEVTTEADTPTKILKKTRKRPHPQPITDQGEDGPTKTPQEGALHGGRSDAGSGDADARKRPKPPQQQENGGGLVVRHSKLEDWATRTCTNHPLHLMDLVVYTAQANLQARRHLHARPTVAIQWEPPRQAR